MRLLHVLSLSLLTVSVSFAQEVSKEIKVLDYKKSGKEYFKSSNTNKQYIANAMANGHNDFFQEAFNYFDDEVESEKFQKDLIQVKKFVKSYINVKQYDKNNSEIKKVIKDLDSFHVTFISNKSLLSKGKQIRDYSYFQDRRRQRAYERKVEELGYDPLAYKLKIETKSVESEAVLEDYSSITENNLDRSIKKAFNKVLRNLTLNAIAKIDSIVKKKRNLKILDDYSVSIDDSNRENMKDSGNKSGWWKEALGKGKEKKAWWK